jgi:hypothetical protein
LICATIPCFDIEADGLRGNREMRVDRFVCAALAVAMVPAAALADDPHDPAMRSAAARARDHDVIRRLNLQELAMVRERDARYAESWRAARAGGGRTDAAADYTARSREHDRAVSAYARDRAAYERDMARWRRAVAACRAGDYAACDG